MFNPHNDPHSEVKRDLLLQSTLAYWASTRGVPDRQDPLAWEAGATLPGKPGAWVWLVLAILIGLTAMLVLVI